MVRVEGGRSSPHSDFSAMGELRFNYLILYLRKQLTGVHVPWIYVHHIANIRRCQTYRAAVKIPPY